MDLTRPSGAISWSVISQVYSRNWPVLGFEVVDQFVMLYSTLVSRRHEAVDLIIESALGSLELCFVSTTSILCFLVLSKNKRNRSGRITSKEKPAMLFFDFGLVNQSLKVFFGGSMSISISKSEALCSWSEPRAIPPLLLIFVKSVKSDGFNGVFRFVESSALFIESGSF
ncbi:hypothetical protein WICPIJ_001265 [Wickerhamomyces pijperi]|uniref:Uncharacterized protein n=1 Tax=Wickerhamomyces pijperi TaxID=599730 RepID=A0A9P8QDN9_WICPI|nr:hypothetical protein WICPIJ_001265 [Wickerhamomyces pijperi]